MVETSLSLAHQVQAHTDGMHAQAWLWQCKATMLLIDPTAQLLWQPVYVIARKAGPCNCVMSASPYSTDRPHVHWIPQMEHT